MSTTLPVSVGRLTAALSDRYRLDREVGQGGMATVYVAHDLRHDREVAIKVLRPELTPMIGAARFLAEIRTTARLQHPHILPLFDSGEAGGFLYYVMPFIAGESLRALLDRETQLPVARAIRIATGVATALDYAHRQGVVHRDIKPENILLHDGEPLVADFGIALALSHAGAGRLTETGMTLGTPQYMSPEQAMGERAITARSDIFALGAVTYEMLAGEPPFTGINGQAVLARVMTADPPALAGQRRSIPAAVESAIRTALEKVPADRFETAADFAAAIAGATSQPTAARRPHPVTRGSRLVIAGASLVALTAAFILGTRAAPATVSPVASFGRATRVTWDSGLEIQPALSPDGRFVAYAAGTPSHTHVYVRQVSGGRAIALVGDSTASESDPSWSPDGARVLFLTRGAAASAPASGGAPRVEVPAEPNRPVLSAAWGPDGSSIAYVVGDSLMLRRGAGASSVLARMLEPRSCRWSADARLVSCASGNGAYATVGPRFGNQSPSRIVVVRVADRRRATVTDSLTLNQSPAWTPDGRWLLFVSSRDGPRDVYAVGIGSDGAAHGMVRRLTTGLNAQTISLSHDGTRLAYAEYFSAANVWSVPRAPGAAVAPAQVTRGNYIVEPFRLSRDGRWLLYAADVGGNADLYRQPLTGGEVERLTTDSSDDFAPDLSPDGREIAFHSWRGGSRDIYVLRLDGGAVQQVTFSPRQEFLARWSPDGRAIAFNDGARGGTWLVRRDSTGKWGIPELRLAYGTETAWSPDGAMLAFTTRPDGGSLAVVGAAAGEPRVLVDAATGPETEAPEYSTDGKSIYFKSHDAAGDASLWTVSATGSGLRRVARLGDAAHPSYRSDWAMDATRIFYMGEDRQSDIVVLDVVRP